MEGQRGNKCKPEKPVGKVQCIKRMTRRSVARKQCKASDGDDKSIQRNIQSRVPTGLRDDTLGARELVYSACIARSWTCTMGSSGTYRAWTSFDSGHMAVARSCLEALRRGGGLDPPVTRSSFGLRWTNEEVSASWSEAREPVEGRSSWINSNLENLRGLTRQLKQKGYCLMGMGKGEGGSTRSTMLFFELTLKHD